MPSSIGAPSARSLRQRNAQTRPSCAVRSNGFIASLASAIRQNASGSPSVRAVMQVEAVAVGDGDLGKQRQRGSPAAGTAGACTGSHGRPARVDRGLQGVVAAGVLEHGVPSEQLDVAAQDIADVADAADRGHRLLGDLVGQEHVVAGMREREVVVAEHPQPQLDPGADRVEARRRAGLLGDRELGQADRDDALRAPRPAA